ncbi:MAG: hypothetical protein KDA77_17950 [Planctomycetaceae bacterium]|nr:hypothetical protein [Planctomycetaceae bacterium]
MSEQTLPEPAAVEKMLESLNLSLTSEVNWQLDSMFRKLTGWGAKSNVKRLAKLARFAEPALKLCLASGETVLYVSKGVRYSFAEQYFMGALWANLINQTVFVLTNARLLMLHTNTKGQPKHTAWMIYYSEIGKFKGSWTGMMDVRLKDGKKIRFSGFPKQDRRNMVEVFEAAMERYQEAGFSPETTQSCENLCGHCFHVVPKDEYRCGECAEEFWTPKQLALRSLVFPSWGDFLMRHYVLAAFELFGYCLGWMFVIAAFTGDDPAFGVISLVIFLFFAHGVDAAVTHAVAKKGLNPRRKPVH